MTKLADIERELEALDALQGQILPTLAELKNERQALQSQRSDILVQIGLGKISKNGIEKIDSNIRAVDQEIADTKGMAKGLKDKKADLTLLSWALKLGEAEKEYRQLTPEVGKICDRYVALRQELQEVCKEYKAKHSRAERLRPWVQDMRGTLGTGQADCGDLPSLKNLNFNLGEHTITPQHLSMEKRW